MLLSEIIEQKRREVALLKKRWRGAKIEKWLKELPKPRPFLKKGHFKLIAEIKRASPSAGSINEKLNVASLAGAYEAAGAGALSVLTDGQYFHGHLFDLNAAKQATTIPVLRKDFIIDKLQVLEARLAGADAVLLIVRILDDKKLRELLKLAKKLGLGALVETHNAAEAKRALRAGAGVIGINNRDLDTLKVDLKTTINIMKAVPRLKSKIIISESGIKSRADVVKLKKAGVDGILVGEALLTSKNLPAKIEELIKGVRCFLVFCLCFIPSTCWAMGEKPTTIEAVQPAVQYVKSFGLPGSGERQFYYPHDIDSGSSGDPETGLGNLVVTDTGNNRVQVFDPDGTFLFQFGSFGTDPGKLNSPTGVAVDFNSRIYISEKDNNRVQLFDIRGNYLGPAATPEINGLALNNPAGMDVDYLGNLYIADSGNDRILKFDVNGNFVSFVGGFGWGDGFFDRPLDVAADRNGYFFVADTGNSRIQEFDQDNRPVLNFGRQGTGEGELLKPASISVDKYLVYVADTGNNRVEIFTKEGKFVLAYGGFNAPTGICLATKGNLYVVDSGNQRIQQLRVSY